MIGWLPRAPWPFFQRLARSPATKVHRLDAGGMVGQGERARLGHAGEHRKDVGFVAPRAVRSNDGMIGEPFGKRRGQGAESGQLRPPVEIGGAMLGPGGAWGREGEGELRIS